MKRGVVITWAPVAWARELPTEPSTFDSNPGTNPCNTWWYPADLRPVVKRRKWPISRLFSDTTIRGRK